MGGRESREDKGWRGRGGLKKATECEMLGTTSWIKLLKQTSQSGAWMCHVYGSCTSRQSFCCCCCCSCCFVYLLLLLFSRELRVHFALHPQKRDGLLRTGTG